MLAGIMVSIAFLPADRERCCLDIDSLIRTLPASLRITRSVDAHTDALVWLPNMAQGNTAAEVAQLVQHSNIKWVQLPMTGVEDFMPLIRATQGKIHWSCAKGCYAGVVAEHALALMLSMMRGLHVQPPPDTRHVHTLHAKHVLLVGNGSIAQALVAILQPLGCIVSTHDSTSAPEWRAADIVVLACPLTRQTTHLCNADMLAQLHPDALLINVARGEVVHTPALIKAINNGLKAAVDVLDESQLDETQKEALQQLVRQGRLLVTPHSAVPASIVPSALGERIGQNLASINETTCNDQPWIGSVDAEKGY